MTTAVDLNAEFAQLMQGLRNDDAAMQAFRKDPVSALKAAGIPIHDAPPPEALAEKPAVHAAAMSAAASNAPTEQVWADTKWWGVEIMMNERLTQDIITGTAVVGTVGSLVAAAMTAGGILAGPVMAPFGIAFAGAIALKTAEIKLVDNGNGVWWPISWPQWVGVLAGIPAGPVGLTATIAAFIHPVRM